MAILPRSPSEAKNKFDQVTNYIETITSISNLDVPFIPFEHYEIVPNRGGILGTNGTDLRFLNRFFDGLGVYNTLTYDAIQQRAIESQQGNQLDDFRHDIDKGVTKPDTDAKNVLMGTYDQFPIDTNIDPTTSTHVVDDLMQNADINDVNDFVRLSFTDKRDGTITQFRSYITNFSDRFNTNFTDSKIIGRANPLKLFSEVSRDVTLEFIVPALARGELKVMYQKLNLLAKLALPQGTGTMIAPLVGFTLGDWFVDELCHLTSLSFDIDPDYPWEVNVEKNLSGDVAELPQVVKVSMGIYIIGNNNMEISNYNIFGVHDRFGLK